MAERQQQEAERAEAERRLAQLRAAHQAAVAQEAAASAEALDAAAKTVEMARAARQKAKDGAEGGRWPRGGGKGRHGRGNHPASQAARLGRGARRQGGGEAVIPSSGNPDLSAETPSARLRFARSLAVSEAQGSGLHGAGIRGVHPRARGGLACRVAGLPLPRHDPRRRPWAPRGSASPATAWHRPAARCSLPGLVRDPAFQPTDAIEGVQGGAGLGFCHRDFRAASAGPGRPAAPSMPARLGFQPPTALRPPALAQRPRLPARARPLVPLGGVPPP